MAILKYKDEDGFWQELSVGTNVAANPTLAGTEANLTGLQVGDTKYKVPEGGLYRHYIIIDHPAEEPDYKGWYGSFYMILYSSTKSTSYTLQELYNIIKGQYVGGAWFGAGGQGNATLFWAESVSGVQYCNLDYFERGTHKAEDEYLPNTITDTVTEI